MQNAELQPSAAQRDARQPASAKAATVHTTKKASTTSHKKRPWTAEQYDALVGGVENFGVGNWAAIRDAYVVLKEGPLARSGSDICNKWRNMKRAEDKKNSRNSEG
jgi:hypothetical protein